MRVTLLSGGVGGARLARGFDALDQVDLSVIVNVGDDQETHGFYVSPDLDTVMYALAGIAGPQGWGRADDTFFLNEELGRFGVDNSFKLGDRDLALKVYRTERLRFGDKLSEVTEVVRGVFGIKATIRPATDDRLRTMVKIPDGWVTFKDYFVTRGHSDDVLELEYEGAHDSSAAPGVIDDLTEADLVVIAPSNPPLSIFPILAVPEIRKALRRHPRVAAVSPLIGGKALRGPADAVMATLAYSPGNVGVAEAYRGLIGRLVIDRSDGNDVEALAGLEVQVTDTVIPDLESAVRLAQDILDR